MEQGSGQDEESPWFLINTIVIILQKSAQLSQLLYYAARSSITQQPHCSCVIITLASNYGDEPYGMKCHLELVLLMVTTFEMVTKSQERRRWRRRRADLVFSSPISDNFKSAIILYDCFITITFYCRTVDNGVANNECGRKSTASASIPGT